MAKNINTGMNFIFFTLAGFHLLTLLSGHKVYDLKKIDHRGSPKITTLPGLTDDLRMWDHGRLRVSTNSQYLEHADGTPFPWIGDTAWQLFYRLRSSDPDGHDIEGYFQDRQNKGFTVIQAVMVDEIDYKAGRGCAENGSMPFINMDPQKRVEAYWKWVDHVVERAREYGLYMCVLPCSVNDQAISIQTMLMITANFLVRGSGTVQILYRCLETTDVSTKARKQYGTA